jgi:hypothetical protein
MARLKQVEFAKLCGIPKSSLPIYIKRNKIIIEDGLVDAENPANVAFQLRMIEKQKSKESNESESEPREKEEKVKNSTNGKPKKEGSHKGAAYHELEKIKKELDIEKTGEEIELLKKKNMKIDGESIPTEIVKSIFSYYGKNITTSFHNTAENWLTKIAKIKGLSNGELAEMRGELAKGINEGVLKAQVESKRAIGNIIKEYSLKREVGEHD